MNERIQKYLSTVPVSKKGIIERAFLKEGSPRGAIKAKCLACSNFDQDEITRCKAVTCPLHAWRPYQKEEK